MSNNSIHDMTCYKRSALIRSRTSVHYLLKHFPILRYLTIT